MEASSNSLEEDSPAPRCHLAHWLSFCSCSGKDGGTISKGFKWYDYDWSCMVWLAIWSFPSFPQLEICLFGLPRLCKRGNFLRPCIDCCPPESNVSICRVGRVCLGRFHIESNFMNYPLTLLSFKAAKGACNIQSRKIPGKSEEVQWESWKKAENMAWLEQDLFVDNCAVGFENSQAESFPVSVNKWTSIILFQKHRMWHLQSHHDW